MSTPSVNCEHWRGGDNGTGECVIGELGGRPTASACLLGCDRYTGPESRDERRRLHQIRVEGVRVHHEPRWWVQGRVVQGKLKRCVPLGDWAAWLIHVASWGRVRKRANCQCTRRHKKLNRLLCWPW